MFARDGAAEFSGDEDGVAGLGGGAEGEVVGGDGSGAGDGDDGWGAGGGGRGFAADDGEVVGFGTVSDAAVKVFDPC